VRRSDVTDAIERFLAGTAHLNIAACGPPGDTQRLYLPDAVPLTEALIQEAGGADSPSVRMIATMAANAFVDHNHQLSYLRRSEHSVQTEANEKRHERIQLRMEKSFQHAVTALELLRRPGPARVTVAVTRAGNVNLGTQQIAVGVQRRRRKKATSTR